MKFLKAKKNKIWLIVTSIVLAILLIANIVLLGVIPGVMNTLLGGDRTVRELGTGDTEYYKADDGITDKASAKAAANKLNERICEEGFVLLKNDGILPLNTKSKELKISVFGQNSVNIAYGSAGSVGGSTADAPTITEALKNSGFDVNPTLTAMYESYAKQSAYQRPATSMNNNGTAVGFPTAELEVSKYTDAVKNSFKTYKDAALVVITRTSGEGNDLPTTMKDGSGNKLSGAAAADDHYLELDQNEQDMLQLACENFDKVILIINSSTALELGFLDNLPDGDATVNNYDYASKVKAALWIGMPGESGLNALGRILNGDVNPSGRTVDTYARDFKKIPAVMNFSCNGESNPDTYTSGGSDVSGGYFIDYEESIYVGYKYYETRFETEKENGDNWYNQNVVYPFGYGLSYTTFSWNVKNKDDLENIKLKENSEIKVEVEVANDSDVAGKDVVELFVALPYKEGGIEKSSKILVDFAKTENVTKDNPQTVTLSFDAYDLASYDYTDANNNGFKGYELEEGEYTLCISKNAHEVVDTVTLKVDETIKFEKDPVTGVSVGNLFDDADDQLKTTLSRNDWDGTFPSMRSQGEKAVDSAFVASLDNRDSGNPLTESSEIVTQNATNRPAAKGVKNDGVMLYDFIGLEDKNVDWDSLLKKLTFKQMVDLISFGAFQTAAIPNIGKLDTSETDGPSGYVNFMDQTHKFDGNCFYCSECVVGATYNKELAYEMGQSIGNEGLFGWKAEDGQRTYSGWYAPGVNIHRTPFGGRNAEYYSEDAFLNGIMAAEVIKGAAEKGVYCYMKHFAANEQETHRGGVCTWITEQAYREIYLKPFEIAVKKGGATAIMSSFNRVGTKWTGGDYRLLTQVLRNEWGFKGTVITDFASNQPHMNIKQMLYAGGDLWLDTLNSSGFSKDNIVDVYLLQEATKHILYTQLHSNVMNGLGDGMSISIKMAYWKIALIVIDVVAVAGFACWGIVNAVLTYKKKEQ